MQTLQATLNWLNDWSRGEVLTAVGILLTAAGIVTALWGWTLRSWLKERRLIAEFGADLYLPEDITNSTRYYVRPDATSVDLAQEAEEGSNVIATRENLFKAVERFIDEESPYRHMLLLADSGMGKSSFVLNYYDYNRRKWFKRYKLAVVPLGHRKALEKVKEVQRPKETILFLDAFDEDPEARKGYEKRLEEIMHACGEFRRVLITCRTQFFSKDSAIPKVATLVFTPRSGAAQHTFARLYLAPFSDRQVNTFLRRRFWFWSFEKKRKARELAKKVPKLTVRPMLLTHIPDLLQTDRRVATAWDIYEIMVERWYEREQGFWKNKEDLKKFSEEVAVQFYLNFLRRGTNRVSREAIAEILLDLMFTTDIDEWNATSRSLLHRDADGNWKFAHRSVMEFLFLKKFFEGDDRCRDVIWTALMKDFVTEVDGAESRPVFLSLGSVRGADLSGVDLSTVNLNSADLRGVNLRGAKLREANLEEADLDDADLTGADLTLARLGRVDLRSAGLDGADFLFAYLEGANLSGKALAGLSFRAAVLDFANMTSVNFSGADLRGASLFGANFSGASLLGVNLSDANLSGVDLSGKKLRGAICNKTNFTGANLSQADLVGADLSQAILRGALLVKTNLEQARLVGADFGKARLGGTNLRGAILSRANLSELDLRTTELRGSELSGVNCTGADFRSVDLSGTDLSRGTFHAANFASAKLSRANLSEADLRQADLSEANLREADLSKANLNGAKLRKADLTDAKVYKTHFLGADLTDTIPDSLLLL